MFGPFARLKPMGITFQASCATAFSIDPGSDLCEVAADSTPGWTSFTGEFFRVDLDRSTPGWTSFTGEFFRVDLDRDRLSPNWLEGTCVR